MIYAITEIILIVATCFLVRNTRNIKVFYLLLVLYVLGVFYVTFLNRSPGEQIANLIPFHFLYWVVRRYKVYGIIGIFSPIFGVIDNILLFVPFGIIASKSLRTNGKTVMYLGFSFCLIIEFVQFFSKRGMFEVDDIVSNALGTWIGIQIYKSQA